MEYRASTLLTLAALLCLIQPVQAREGIPSTGETPQTTQQREAKHDGGKDDIDAIGNRHIGDGGLGNWYSLEREIRMGKEYAQLIDSNVKLVQDPLVVEYVNRVGQNVVRNSDSKVPFTIKVIDASEINAFSLPGGFLYVHSGLLLAADEEAELAGVMAHEIAHVAARHATRQMTRATLANLASIPLIFVGGGAGYAVRSAAGIGLPMTFLKFSRGFEEEADYLGLQYMYKRATTHNHSCPFSRRSRRKKNRSRELCRRSLLPIRPWRVGLQKPRNRSIPSSHRVLSMLSPDPSLMT